MIIIHKKDHGNDNSNRKNSNNGNNSSNKYSKNDTYTIILNFITYIYIYTCQNNIYKSAMPNSLMIVIIAAIMC